MAVYIALVEQKDLRLRLAQKYDVKQAVVEVSWLR